MEFGGTSCGRAIRTYYGSDISEAGELPYFSDKRFLDLRGLNNVFVAKNINHFKGSAFAPKFGDYVAHKFGWPDIYVHPLTLSDIPFANLALIGGEDKYKQLLFTMHKSIF